jgi:hypothetical protein
MNQNQIKQFSFGTLMISLLLFSLPTPIWEFFLYVMRSSIMRATGYTYTYCGEVFAEK